jgi:hypothetical protein
MTASSTYPDGKHPCWAKIWQSSVPPKVKIFAWKAASGALATEDNKKRHHILVRGRCKICDAEKEDVAHALYSCPHAFALWKEMRQVWSLPQNKDLKTPSSNWFQSVASSKGFLCSYIRLLKDIKHKPPVDIIKGKGPMIFVGAQQVSLQPHTRQSKQWTKPPMGWVKLSIDGSFLNHSAGLGMVLRDTEGLPIFVACNLDDCQVPLEAELRAGVEGLKLALALPICRS